MSALILKLIAAASMLADHTGLMLFPDIEMLRIVGRLAFPIYAFFIAEGFRYTRNRHRYFLRIFLLGAACQLVYTIAEKDFYIGVLLTFSLSIIVMAFVDKVKKAIRGEENIFETLLAQVSKNKPPKAFVIMFASAASVFVIALVYMLCKVVEVDYGFWGVMLPVFTSLFGERYQRLASFSLGLILMCIFISPGFTNQYYSLVTIPLLCAYNGEPGKPRMKYFFYIFYPAHLALIYLISLFM